MPNLAYASVFAYACSAYMLPLYNPHICGKETDLIRICDRQVIPIFVETLVGLPYLPKTKNGRKEHML